MPINIEIKAICRQPEQIRKYLQEHATHTVGTDLQTDTYFHTQQGRLKLRQGNIENNLIYYERENQAGPKSSGFQLFPLENATGLLEILTKALGIKAVVRKKREIFYIRNVKFHIDELEGLGSFVEIEACEQPGNLREEELLKQCRFYMQEFGVKEEDLISNSYSEMG